MIRVLLAEDQAMVRGALAALLTLEGDIEIIAEVGRGDEVLTVALATKPDVALLDIEMPGCDGITAAAALHAQLPSCRVLILTTFGRPGYLRKAMESGVVGFLLKDAPSVQLATAIRRAVAGERVVDPKQPAHRTGTRCIGSRHKWSEYFRNRCFTLPLRRHRAQLPLGGHPEARSAQPGRSSPHRRGEGLALAGML